MGQQVKHPSKCKQVLHLGLHLASGACRTSPVESLYMKCNKWTYNDSEHTQIFMLWKSHRCFTILLSQIHNPTPAESTICFYSLLLQSLRESCATLQRFLTLQQKHKCAEFYTDASKTATSVSCAAHGPSFSVSKTMNGNTSILTAKAYGIPVVNHINQNHIPQSIIYTDSPSVVETLSCDKILQQPRYKHSLEQHYVCICIKT